MIKEQFKDYIDLSRQVIHVDRPRFDFALNMETEAVEITRKYPLRFVTVEELDLSQYDGKNVYCITALFTVYIANLKIKQKATPVVAIHDDYDRKYKFCKNHYLVDYDSIVAEDNIISTVVNEVSMAINIDSAKFKDE